MKALGILFSVLGLLLHLRMNEWVLDSELFGDFVSSVRATPLVNRPLAVGAILLPFGFYGICLAMCLVKHKQILLTGASYAVGLLAIPYFMELDSHAPSIAKNALGAAFFSYPCYWLKKPPADDPTSEAIRGDDSANTQRTEEDDAAE